MQHGNTSPTTHQPWAEEEIDAAVIKLIGDDQTLWSVDEIAAELSHLERVALLDSLGRLRSAGVVHRCDQLWKITRAAQHTHHLTGCQ
jgi:hypothetical protein